MYWFYFKAEATFLHQVSLSGSSFQITHFSVNCPSYIWSHTCLAKKKKWPAGLRAEKLTIKWKDKQCAELIGIQTDWILFCSIETFSWIKKMFHFQDSDNTDLKNSKLTLKVDSGADLKKGLVSS